METEHQVHTGFRNIKNDAKEYVEKRIQLLIMTIGEKVATTVADTAQKATGAIVLLSGVWFAWFALCFFLSDLVGNLGLGFLLGALPLLLMGVIFLKLRPRSFTRNIQASIKKEILSSLDSMNGHDNVEEESRRHGR